MINNVVLVGRMTKDADLRHTGNNQAVATFTLAVNRNFKNANGEREADFISCVIWRQQAENLANWAKKGVLIGITGRIQTRNYENSQGQRVYVTEVVADTFQVLERTDRNNQQNQQPQQGAYNGPQGLPNRSMQEPAPNQGNQNRPGNQFGPNPFDIADDDLPF